MEQHLQKVLSMNEKQALHADDQGLTTVEYIILLFCIVIPGIVAWQQFHCELDSKINESSWTLEALE